MQLYDEARPSPCPHSVCILMGKGWKITKKWANNFRSGFVCPAQRLLHMLFLVLRKFFLTLCMTNNCSSCESGVPKCSFFYYSLSVTHGFWGPFQPETLCFPLQQCCQPDFGPLGSHGNHPQEFPGSPVVRTLCFHCRGHRFDSKSEN